MSSSCRCLIVISCFMLEVNFPHISCFVLLPVSVCGFFYFPVFSVACVRFICLFCIYSSCFLSVSVVRLSGVSSVFLPVFLVPYLSVIASGFIFLCLLPQFLFCLSGISLLFVSPTCLMFCIWLFFKLEI